MTRSLAFDTAAARAGEAHRRFNTRAGSLCWAIDAVHDQIDYDLGDLSHGFVGLDDVVQLGGFVHAERADREA